jgi:thioredoxin reductase
MSIEQQIWDAIIIGGSYSGLAAALALGRSQRTTLILDGGKPCNRQTPHSQNFLTQDGKTPAAIASLAKEQVLCYPGVSFREANALSAAHSGDGFEVTTDSGDHYRGRKLILATGITDVFPDIAGIGECWGISVIHCPYCHGYEHRSQVAGILAKGPVALHLAPLVHNLNPNLSVLSNGPSELDEEQRNRLQRNGVSLIEQEIASIDHQNGYLRKLIFRDGSELELEVLYAALTFIQPGNIAGDLGCTIDEHGYIAVNEFYETNIAGVYACGDNTSLMRSLSKSVFSGSVAGASANRALAEEAFS